MKSNWFFIFAAACLPFASVIAGPSAGMPAASSARTVQDFDFDWRFSKGDFPTAAMPRFDDSGWRQVNVPHDWSIEGPFSANYGSGNGYAPGGLGWYRKHFQLDDAQKGRLVTIEFDGVYDYSEVWINGVFVGTRPYGYSSFAYDLTPYLKFGRDENVVAVRVDHSRFADSRWYTGSGIYRHVRLCVTDKLHIAHWGTYVTTPEISDSKAVVRVETTVENATAGKQSFTVESDLLAPDGQVVASSTASQAAGTGTSQTVVQKIRVSQPQLWSLDAPALYTLRSRLKSGEIIVDETTTPFGIRTAIFNPNKGFLLNGQPLKLKGVCIHEDAGCLGVAVPDKMLERRLRLLKEIGVNAIRTSHNPPAPELLEMCDRLGLLVKDEAFDEFTPSKKKWVSGRNNGLPSRFGYAELFNRWSVTDISDMIRRDRNHPSIILWSIGNEIDYANDPFTDPVLGNDYQPGNPPAQDMVKLATPLIAAVKSLDRTRPVTAALANLPMSESVGLPELLDAVGYNYQEARYPSDHKKFPQRIIFGSETSQQYSAWRAVQDNDYVAGQFLWTGIDYLGEANAWPNRASGAGLLDLCGDLDLVARLEFTRQQLGRERVEQMFLNRALERARAELRIVAFAGQQLLRGGVHVEREILLREALLQPAKLDVHDARQFAFVEALENDHVVHAVQEFRAEMFFQLGHHLVLHRLMRRLVGLAVHEIFLDDRRAEVAGHDDDGVLEIHRAALAVREPAVVEHLQQHVEHVGCAFSISSNKITEYGLRRTASLSCPPSS
jgi:beta-galactosidase